MNINPYAKGAASGAYEQGVKTAADYGEVTSQLAAIANKMLPANTIVLFGDSIINNNVSAAPYAENLLLGFWTRANILMRHKFCVVAELGVDGNKTSQMLARIEDVLSVSPGWCFVLGGINDVAADLTSTAIIANLKSIYDTLRENHIRVIAATILPSTVVNSTARKTVINAVNRWIKEYTWNNSGIILIDWHSVIADPATGAPLSGTTLDGTHPNGHGAALLGKFVYDVVNPLVPNIDLLPNSITDTVGNLLPNPFFTGDVSGKATGYSVTAATSTPTKVARTDGKPGEWQQFSVLGAGNVYCVYTLNNIVPTQIQVGDKIYAQIEFETDDNIVGLTEFQLEIDMINSGATTGIIGDNIVTASAVDDVRMPSGVLRTPEMAIPAETTGFAFYFQMKFAGESVGGTVRIGRAEIRKVNY